MSRTPGNELSAGALAGGGDMGARIRAFAWDATPLGPLEGWSPSLLGALGLMLHAQMPMWLGWGPECRFFYNDAYVQVLGAAKHPWALGRPAAEVWAEIWDVCGPLAERVFRAGEAPFVEDVRLFMDRGGRLEEVYYSFSYSPIRDETGRVAGLFCPNTEVTAKLLHARRLRTLSELSARALVEKTTATACRSAMATIAKNPDDVPFAVLYLADAAGAIRREQAVGAIPAGPDEVWPLADVLASGRARALRWPPDVPAPIGLAGQPVAEVIVSPVTAAGHEQAVGVMVAGVNPTRRLDDEYRTFYELLAAQVATAIHNATAAEAERRRADVLAELDRAKTAFFSNVSHEFRTPLTLMIGPTEDALRAPDPALRGEALEAVYRNELRLLKLVNGLLDFSRLEAGRMVAVYEPVDLAALTADLASSFRSAIEQAGLRFEVDTPPLPRPVHVDRDMWEKIVLNLLSNALKFTLEGSIRVALRMDGEHVELRVADTGTGIPADEMPRLFERFHRIDNPQARTQEGTGIGLALVQELARLHGGAVTAASELGRGTELRVTMPIAHERAAAAAATPPAAGRLSTMFVEEAGRWSAGGGETSGASGAAHVLLADDNADMRDYLRRLLAEHWRVTAVADGAAALEAARRDPPDLVLTDVMMPGLDGFQLLAALRADERTRNRPVIMLSARAGDEARVDGLAAGADDYLVKPFSARELIARVHTHLTLARLRRQAERDLEEVYGLLMQVPAAITVRRGPALTCVFQNEASQAIAEQRGRALLEIWPEVPEHLIELQHDVMRTGRVYTEREVPVTRVWQDGVVATRYWDISYAPVRFGAGPIDAVMTIGFDVTERVEARHAAEAAQARLRAALEASAIGTFFWDVRTGTVEHDEGVERLFGLPGGAPVHVDAFVARIHPDDRVAFRAAIARSAEHGDDFDLEYRVVAPDGAVRWLLDKGRVIRGADGRPAAMAGALVDITEPKRLAEVALEASRAKDEFLAMLGHELRNPLAPIVTALHLMRLRGDGGSKEVATIERQVQHLTRLVDDLLDISRVTRGLIELRRERRSIAEIVAKGVEIASPLIEQRGHHLAVDVPADLWVDGDPVRLGQVLANLLTNAARYTPAAGRIAIEARRDGEGVAVSVADDGIGIEPAMLDRIFELFVQGGERGGRGEGGLGIGLALVRTLTRMHGGEVVAESGGPGRGSRFTITLPAVAADAPVVGGVVPASSRAGSARRVLLVDDNLDAAALLGDALRELGHAVEVAHDGPSALALLDGFSPEVAVLDIGLPVMDGYELARRLRERGLHGCRLIALTGYGQEGDRARSRDAGFDLHMVKPIDVDALADALAD